MSATVTTGGGFRHKAFLYSSEAAFVSGMVRYVRDALAAGDPVLIAVAAGSGATLREGLGADAERVRFADMETLGRNPGRIIPVWREWVRERAASGRRVRGIGESVWPGRTAAELVECAHHETLLNRAFAGGCDWELICPYDTAGLAPERLRAAWAAHPHVLWDDAAMVSPLYRDDSAAQFASPLPPAPVSAYRMDFSSGGLPVVRAEVTDRAERAGMDRARVRELIVAVSEAAGNSIRHGGGGGTLRMWREADTVTCEVSDAGRIAGPLVGRSRPTLGQDGGRGVWLIHQICDLVQIRSAPDGTVVRMRMDLAHRTADHGAAHGTRPPGGG